MMKLTPASMIQIFEPAMCCSTGVCGPAVDTQLVQFADDLEWVKSKGIAFQRQNLAQNPAAFVENPAVRTMLAERGESVLPILIVNGLVRFFGRYPNRDELAEIFNLNATPSVSETMGECCSGNDCCG